MSLPTENRSMNGFSHYESFGSFLLLKKLATGGMAEVFLARSASLKQNGRVQVIKRILPHVANDVQFIRMFQQEIQVCLGFNHPHTVQVHDFGDIQRQPYIVMEYVEGKNLKDIIIKVLKRNEMLPIPMALSLVSQAAAGLHYAHTFVNKVTGEEVHAVHRDISPHNLLVSYDGNLKVIDFGIAKAASGMQEATRTGTIKGKFAYLSPEQITSQPVDARADIFALGIVAWELLTLQRPFYREGDSELTILGRVNNCDEIVRPPSFHRPEIPAEVDEVILKALRHDPNERYATAAEFQSALRRVMQAYYPNYTYADNGRIMHELFAEEIESERQEIRTLNLDAQMSLSDPDATIAQSSDSNQLPPIPTLGAPVRFAGIDMDFRLREIEKVMKQKASMRHYVLFAFYLISVLAIKVDEYYYSLFDFLIPKSKIAFETQVAQAPASYAPMPTARVVSQPQSVQPTQNVRAPLPRATVPAVSANPVRPQVAAVQAKPQPVRPSLQTQPSQQQRLQQQQMQRRQQAAAQPQPVVTPARQIKPAAALYARPLGTVSAPTASASQRAQVQKAQSQVRLRQQVPQRMAVTKANTRVAPVKNSRLPASAPAKNQKANTKQPARK